MEFEQTITHRFGISQQRFDDMIEFVTPIVDQLSKGCNSLHPQLMKMMECCENENEKLFLMHHVTRYLTMNGIIGL